MKQVTLLREYLRTCRRVKLQPSADGFKKLEYLRFIGADVCPACGEEVDAEVYQCNSDDDGNVAERYSCPSCGSEFVFPQDVVH